MYSRQLWKHTQDVSTSHYYYSCWDTESVFFKHVAPGNFIMLQMSPDLGNTWPNTFLQQAEENGRTHFSPWCGRIQSIKAWKGHGSQAGSRERQVVAFTWLPPFALFIQSRSPSLVQLLCRTPSQNPQTYVVSNLNRLTVKLNTHKSSLWRK